MKANKWSWARLGALAAVLTTGLSTSACTTSTPTAAPTTSPISTTSPAPASPSPTTDPRVALTDMVKAAGLRPKDLGVATPKSQDTVASLATPCNTSLAASNVAAHTWTFSDANPPVVSNSVYAYYPQTGTSIVEQLRPTLTACKTWTWADTWKMEVIGAFTVTAPAGADNVVAYCHHGTLLTGSGKGNTAYLCDGVLSRGHLVAQVGTVQLTLATAQSALTKALALASAGLVRAVAAP